MSDAVLVLTEDPALLEAVLGLCAVAGVEPEVATDIVASGTRWRSAGLVVVGIDAARRAVGAARAGAAGVPARASRSGVVLAGRGAEPSVADDLWPLADAIAAEATVVLPGAQAWLLDRIAASTEQTSPHDAVVVAVAAGRGGAGASTLAASLALVAASDGLATLLVDVDAWGGGIDMVLGREDEPGLRWPDLVGVEGRLPRDALATLPRRGRLGMLSCGRGESARLPAAAVASVLDAGRRDHDLVVVDLPRSLDSVVPTVLRVATCCLVVVPAEVRATAAAARVADAVRAHVRDVRLVVRGPAPSGLTGPLVADALGLPLAGWLDPEPDLARAQEHGRPPATDPKRPLARLCRSLLADLVPAGRRVA